jgi:hypothetical protein
MAEAREKKTVDIDVVGCTDEQIDHLQYLISCWETYCDRDRERTGMWREDGIKGNTYFALCKVRRAWRQVLGKGAPARVPSRDHYVDLINYSVFCLQIIDDPDLSSDAKIDGEVF